MLTSSVVGRRTIFSVSMCSLSSSLLLRTHFTGKNTAGDEEDDSIESFFLNRAKQVERRENKGRKYKSMYICLATDVDANALISGVG